MKALNLGIISDYTLNIYFNAFYYISRNSNYKYM